MPPPTWGTCVQGPRGSWSLVGVPLCPLRPRPHASSPAERPTRSARHHPLLRADPASPCWPPSPSSQAVGTLLLGSPGLLTLAEISVLVKPALLLHLQTAGRQENARARCAACHAPSAGGLSAGVLLVPVTSLQPLHCRKASLVRRHAGSTHTIMCMIFMATRLDHHTQLFNTPNLPREQMPRASPNLHGLCLLFSLSLLHLVLSSLSLCLSFCTYCPPANSFLPLSQSAQTAFVSLGSRLPRRPHGPPPAPPPAARPRPDSSNRLC